MLVYQRVIKISDVTLITKIHPKICRQRFGDLEMSKVEHLSKDESGDGG